MTKACLVTGGSRGIGLATAIHAARDGWDVAIVYREHARAADEAVRAIAGLGRRTVAIKADVGNEIEIIAAFDQAVAALGPLSGLVNSAGISVSSRVDALAKDDLDRMFRVNVIGLMLCCREAARRMSTQRGNRGGSIVNVSSMAATIGGRPGSSAYAATKGAVDVFTTGFAREVAAEGIRVNAVRPGVTDTDMIERMRSPDRRSAIEATIPMGRFGRAEEVAAAAVWLLSEQASFVSGAHLNVSGGGFHMGAPSN